MIDLVDWLIERKEEKGERRGGRGLI